jgi:iron complex outermembrane receptor protein
VDRQGFKDDRTSFTRGHALWRSTLISGERKSWVTGDLTMLAQDPASPHPRDGATLSTAVPVDANHNPNDAYLNNTRFMISGGLDRPVGQGSLWGTTASFSHSSQRIFRGFLTDLSNTPDNASGFKENIDINDAYVDTHVLWAEHARLRFMTGVDVLFSSGEAKGATFTYTVPLDGSTATSVPEPSTLDKDAGDTRLFLGAYGSAEWRPSSRVTVNGGLRLNMTSERHGEGETVNHTRPSGDFGVLFGLWEKNADHLRLFASYKNTFKPAAFDFSLAENEDVLDPETSQSIEGGLKFRGLKGRFDLEASAFRMDLENMVIATEVNGVPALENAGKTRFRGVELAADYRLPHAILARATYSYHDSRFVDFVQEFDGVPTQLAGNRIEMVPRQLMSAGLSYSPEKGFIANANVNYTGDRYLNKRNTALAEAYLTVDAGIGYRTGRLEVRMDGRNLSDRRDPVSESEFGDAQYYLMPARTVRISAVLTY